MQTRQGQPRAGTGQVAAANDPLEREDSVVAASAEVPGQVAARVVSEAGSAE